MFSNKSNIAVMVSERISWWRISWIRCFHSRYQWQWQIKAHKNGLWNILLIWICFIINCCSVWSRCCHFPLLDGKKECAIKFTSTTKCINLSTTSILNWTLLSSCGIERVAGRYRTGFFCKEAERSRGGVEWSELLVYSVCMGTTTTRKKREKLGNEAQVEEWGESRRKQPVDFPGNILQIPNESFFEVYYTTPNIQMQLIKWWTNAREGKEKKADAQHTVNRRETEEWRSKQFQVFLKYF